MSGGTLYISLWRTCYGEPVGRKPNAINFYYSFLVKKTTYFGDSILVKAGKSIWILLGKFYQVLLVGQKWGSIRYLARS